MAEQNARISLEIADDDYVLDDGIIAYSGSAFRQFCFAGTIG